MTMRAPWDAIVWWEIRRIPFNLAIGLVGFATSLTIVGVGDLLVKPGEDFVEPMLLIVGGVVYGLAANAFYTLGWVSELLWTRGDTSKTAAIRSRIFWLGLSASAGLTLLPAGAVVVLWALSGFPVTPPNASG